jgi:Fe-S-cluster-containing dehydrogenase component
MGITRRKLLQGAVTAGAGLALSQLPTVARAAAQESPPDPDAPGVLYDITQCVGCHFCEVACQINKGLPPEITLINFKRNDPSTAPKGIWAIRRHQCMHCIDPACAAACPVAAMYKTEEGPVIYKDERCLGCRYCMNACPFGVPTFDWDKGMLDGALIRKCNMSFERLQEGKQPACVAACPAKAVIFGKRSELLKEAKDRIAKNPDRYVDHIYGEHEAGGTSFLLLASLPFDKYGLPDPGDKPIPPLARGVMGLTIPVGVTWAAVLAGVTTLVQLRQRGQADHKPAGKEDAE